MDSLWNFREVNVLVCGTGFGFLWHADKKSLLSARFLKNTKL